MPSVARKGDLHSCPLHGVGTIIQGSPTTTAEGKPVARVGDTVMCPDGSVAVILPNNACVSVDDKRIARKGDLTSHGGIITTGADTVTVADGEVQVLMGKDLAPIKDGKFRLYINSPCINIHKNMHFGNEENNSKERNKIIGIAEILAGGIGEIAGIPEDEAIVGEEIQVASTKLIKDGVTKVRGTRTKNRLPDGKGNNIGPKNGKLEKRNPQTNELQQTRIYDSNGKPIKNIDYGHDHNGAGDPHVHDWYYPSPQSPNPVRGSARPLQPGDD